MSDKLIEAVAKALFDTIHREHRGDAWPTTRDDIRDGWRKQARSALSAIEASGYRVVPKDPAPDMAEALEKCVEHLRCVRLGYSSISPEDMARAALAKARGEA